MAHIGFGFSSKDNNNVIKVNDNKFEVTGKANFNELTINEKTIDNNGNITIKDIKCNELFELQPKLSESFIIGQTFVTTDDAIEDLNIFSLAGEKSIDDFITVSENVVVKPFFTLGKETS